MFFDNFAAIGLRQQHALLSPGFAARATTESAYAASRAYFEFPQGGTLLDRLLYADIKTYLVELLMKQDQMSMAASIESRVPFLDHRLVEFVAALPPRLKLRGLTTKWILREAVRDLLPPEIVSRRKMGFPVPFGRWMQQGWDAIARDVLLDRRSRERGIIAPFAVERLIRDHANGAIDGSDALWSLLNLELWYRTFVDGDGVQTLSAPTGPRWKGVAGCGGHGMNVLWLNAGLLLPLDKGGKLRTWHLMRQLARRHHISYLSFADPTATPGDLDGMLDVCRRLDTVPRRDPPKGTWRFRLDAARYIPQRVPYAIAKYRSASYRRRVSDLLRQRRFDVIVCDFLVPLVNLPEDLPYPTVLFTHNVEAEIWRRQAATAANPVARALLRQQWRRMARFERRALARCDLVLAVSHADVDTFSRLYHGAARRPMHVVQTGVDTEYFSPGAAPPRPAHLVFTGSMDWLPNEDAMRYFVHEILPRIRAVEPSVTLSIVGRDPTSTVQQLADHAAGIEVTGRVNDVRPDIERSQVYVVPLRIGGGTRLKIFEAMAMGRAVVSTTIGAEGLPVTSGSRHRHCRRPRRVFAGRR